MGSRWGPYPTLMTPWKLPHDLTRHLVSREGLDRRLSWGCLTTESLRFRNLLETKYSMGASGATPGPDVFFPLKIRLTRDFFQNEGAACASDSLAACSRLRTWLLPDDL